jgi:hypothetical protein
MYNGKIQPFFLGAFIIYASSLPEARKGFELLIASLPKERSGALELPDGSRITWINMRTEELQ